MVAGDTFAYSLVPASFATVCGNTHFRGRNATQSALRRCAPFKLTAAMNQLIDEMAGKKTESFIHLPPPSPTFICIASPPLSALCRVPWRECRVARLGGGTSPYRTHARAGAASRDERGVSATHFKRLSVFRAFSSTARGAVPTRLQGAYVYRAVLSQLHAAVAGTKSTVLPLTGTRYAQLLARVVRQSANHL